jgi:hypothetical protein
VSEIRNPYVADSATSQAAAESIKPLTGEMLLKVLAAIRNAGLNGLTDDEGQTITGLGGSTYRPRRVNLQRVGLVFDYGVRRKTASGREAVVWFAVEKAMS